MELFKYVYFCAKKSTIKAGNNKFQDLINAPRILIIYYLCDKPNGLTLFLVIASIVSPTFNIT